MRLIGLTQSDRKKLQAQSLEEKVELGKEVVRRSLDEFGWENAAIAWTGGKDSTVLLWLVKQVAKARGRLIPRVIFVDEGDVFPEIWEFVKKIKRDWQLNFSVAHNEDVSSKAKKLGDPIKVSDLNERNQSEVRRIGFEEDEFPFEPESFVGNHLMKTVATNIWLEENKVRALFTGVRWDEQGARGEDDFWRELQDPHHFRVEPILHFFEKDIWAVTHKCGIPYVRLYAEGYRSLGARVTTQKTDSKPAWEQDLEHTSEREGRRQDKEKIMERLRDLGYM